MSELVQRHGFVRRTYAFVSEGIRVSERSLTSGRTVTIPYEVMYGDREELMTASKGALWTGIAMVAFAGIALSSPDGEPYAWAFWTFLAVICGVLYWMSRRDQIGFNDGTWTLYFFKDNPSTRAVDSFLREAQDRARARIRDRLLPLERTGDTAIDKARAATLRDKGIISDAEHADFVKSLGSSRTPPETLQN